jgi:hypothetical protein
VGHAELLQLGREAGEQLRRAVCGTRLVDRHVPGLTA